MNSYPINNTTQNQRAQYHNYIPGPTTNQFQAPINNFNQIIPQYASSQPSIPSGYNQVNMVPPRMNLTYQQNNIRVSPPNPNANVIQSQNSPNIIYQSPMINTYLSYSR